MLWMVSVPSQISIHWASCSMNDVMRIVRVLAVAVVLGTLSAACGGGSPAPAQPKQQETKPAAPAAPKAAASPSTPKPSPTADPAGRTDPTSGECPPSHLLKGTTDAAGQRIYYEPDRPEYPTVTPEVCFTAGGDARAAGYQSSRR
jgi:hypothetical protein